MSIDLEKYFDTIQHDRLIKVLSKFCDQSTLELVRKLISVGYIDLHNLNDSSKYAVKGIPQGSILSPLLSNIYLNEFDQFVETSLIAVYNKGEGRPPLNPLYYKEHKLSETDLTFSEAYPELKESILRVKHAR
jgi:retron-type reverse transcriptase